MWAHFRRICDTKISFKTPKRPNIYLKRRKYYTHWNSFNFNCNPVNHAPCWFKVLLVGHARSCGVEINKRPKLQYLKEGNSTLTRVISVVSPQHLL